MIELCIQWSAAACPSLAALTPSSQSAEVEETIKRIRSHRGVEGVMIVNMEGVTLKSTMDAETTEAYAAMVSQVRGNIAVWASRGCARRGRGQRRRAVGG